MAKNKTTPLKQITDLGPDDLDKLKDLDLENLDLENLDLSNIDLSNVNFDKVKKKAIGDIAFALDPRIGSIIPKKEDTSVVDKRIAQIEKPTTTSVWDKQAAYYRQTGEGAVLRTQKDIGALFNPAIDMWTKRTAMANAKFEMLKQQIPEFDESIIFGDQTDTPIPIVNEVKNISMSVKEDLRTLSRMNVNDPRYDELRKKVEKDQKVIVQFDEINQKLLKIRNDVDIQGINSDEWSKGMTPGEREMWMDIMTSKGENITIENGKVMWTGGEGVNYEFEIDESGDSKKIDMLGGVNTTLGELHFYSRNNEGGNSTSEQMKNSLTESGILGYQKALKELYPEHDFGTTGENNDGMDGKWGDKTAAAYEKYLKDKGGLETAYFDENMSEEDREKYAKVTPGESIDLSTIGDGPTLTSGNVASVSVSMQAFAYQGVSNGASLDAGNELGNLQYTEMHRNLVQQYNALSIQDQASLLFDSTGDPNELPQDVIATNDFLDNVLAKNVPGYENMSPEQKEAEINKLIKGGMNEMYNNPETGERQTLGSMFKTWYVGKVEEKAFGLSETQQRSVRGNGNVKSKKRERRTNGGPDTRGPGTDGPGTDVVTPVENPYTRFENESGELFSELSGPGGFEGVEGDALLFDYGNDEFMENTLNNSYGLTSEEWGGGEGVVRIPGFKFTATGTMQDWIKVEYRNTAGNVVTKEFEFDNMTNKKDLRETTKMQEWMRQQVGKDKEDFYQGTSEVYTGTESGGYTPKDVEGGPVSTEGGPVSTEGGPDVPATTFRNTMSASKQQKVNKFDVMGSIGGAGKAAVFRGGRPITFEHKEFGFTVATVTGVEARGKDLVVTTNRDEYDMGKFVKSGDGYKFVKGDAYDYLEGGNKEDFDAFVEAIETDNAFAEQVLASVHGNNDFIVKNY